MVVMTIIYRTHKNNVEKRRAQMRAANEIPREELLVRDVSIQFWELRRVREENDRLKEENRQLKIIKQAYEALKTAL